ncbi:MAG: VWA domain-containing protein [Myxococcales bacterium]|nr:VWA domain-containing protein [Myxococcales bacterium]MCB9581576.1 VWA domain-containing protein [Polyangiaceae bacterium]
MTRTAAFGVLTLSMVAAMSSCSSGDPELAGSGGSGFGAQGGEAGVAGGGNVGGSAATGGGGSAGSGGGQAGSAGSGGAGGGLTDASVSDASDATAIPDVVFSYDGPVDDGSLADACASVNVEAKLKELDMVVMLDRSGSMSEPGFAWYAPASDCNVGDPIVDSKWCRAVNALGQYFQSSAAQGNRAALQYFPLASAGTCPAPGYGTPAVGLTLLPSASQALVSSLNTEGPLGTFTPTQDAIVGANAFSQANQDPNRVMVSILITDGKPNTCPVSTGSGLAQIVSQHFTSTGIPSYVIGMTGADFAGLETIAAGGGTQAHADAVGTLLDTCGDGAGPCHHWNVGNGDPAVFVEALKVIQQQAIGCTLAIPTPSGGVPDWSKVEVDYYPGGNPPATTLPKVTGAAQCSGDGWYYDNPASPTQVNLCPTTCTTVQADFAAKVELRLGCLGS